MIFYETPKHTGMDLSQSIQGHTADEVLTYKTVSGQLLLLACFYPPDYQPERSYPAIAMIHGGGWSSQKIFDDQSGWAGDHLGFLARLFAMRGFLAFSIDYRLLPNASLTDMIEDCRDAVAYIKQRFALETLDLLGESAGGYLAAAVDAFLGKPQFRHLILANPITDLTLDRWGEFAPEGADKAALSLVLHVSAQCSPTLLLHGEADTTVSPEHSLRYHDAMQKAGVPCDLLLLENTTHAFLLAEYYKDIAACETALEWLYAKLKIKRK